MYFLLGISLALSLLLVLNLLITAAATVLWRVLAPAAKSWMAQSQAQIIFALRIFPFAAALIFVAAFLIPAYLLYEPYSSGERIGFKLALLAYVSITGIVIAAFRVFGTWRRTKRLAADWRARAELISVTGVSIPVYRFYHPFPVIAIVGAIRPRMFIADQIFHSLDGEEFQAAIRHECGHLSARDNFKRILMRFSSDLLIFRFGQTLDRAWMENVECAADEFAAQTGGATALNLASALVKIAKIIPPNTTPAMPAGAFLIEAETADVTWRVRHLLRLAEIKFIPAEYRAITSENAFLLYAFAIFAATTMLAMNHTVLYKMHLVLENVVHFFQ